MEPFGYYYWSFILGSTLQLIGLDLFVFPSTINTLGGPKGRPFWQLPLSKVGPKIGVLYRGLIHCDRWLTQWWSARSVLDGVAGSNLGIVSRVLPGWNHYSDTIHRWAQTIYPFYNNWWISSWHYRVTNPQFYFTPYLTSCLPVNHLAE